MKRKIAVFKIWELFLLALAGLMFFASLSLYIGNVSLRQYFLGVYTDDEAQVAQLKNALGSVKRQKKVETGFLNVETGLPLFNLDTIVTGPGSSASILLDEDGSAIDLEQNTMVRLAFEKKLGVGGVSRVAGIKLITGKVSGRIKSKKVKVILQTATKTVELTREKPEVKVEQAPVVAFRAPPPALAPPPVVAEPPKPVTARLVSPTQNAVVTLDAFSTEFKKEVPMTFEVQPDGVELLFKLKKAGRGLASSDDFERTLSVKGGRLLANPTLTSPGDYEWELVSTDESHLQKAHGKITLASEYIGIEALSPLIAGQSAMKSSRYAGKSFKDFQVSLNWKALDDVKSYTVRITDANNPNKILTQKEVSDTTFSLNKNKVFSGNFFYTVSARLPAGFVAQTKTEKFSFGFEPPLLTTPTNNVVIARSTLKNGILFTWQKTNFTEAYEIEVSSAPTFQSNVVKQKVENNFYLFKQPSDGKFWWHVRSIGKGDSVSSFSPAQQIQVKQ